MISTETTALLDIDSLLRKTSLESQQVGLQRLAELLQQDSPSDTAYSALLNMAEYFTSKSSTNKFRKLILKTLIPIQNDLAKMKIQKQTTELFKRFEALLMDSSSDCHTRTLTFL